jgi:hypothetical protein
MVGHIPWICYATYLKFENSPQKCLGFAISVVQCGVVWCGVVWCGVVWCGVVWCGVVWCGVNLSQPIWRVAGGNNWLV